MLQLLKGFKCKVTLSRESPRFAGAEVLLDASFTVENAPLPQNAPKLVEWCKKCTKTLLYQKLRYNSTKSLFCPPDKRDFLHDAFLAERDARLVRNAASPVMHAFVE